MSEQVLNEEEVKEVNDLNSQFVDFLNTKGIKAKFKLAFANMKESAKKQHEIDKENFEAVKADSKERFEEAKKVDPDFQEFKDAEGLKEKGYAIDKKQVKPTTSLSSLGYHNVDIELHKKVVATIKVSLTK